MCVLAKDAFFPMNVGSWTSPFPFGLLHGMRRYLMRVFYSRMSLRKRQCNNVPSPSSLLSYLCFLILATLLCICSPGDPRFVTLLYIAADRAMFTGAFEPLNCTNQKQLRRMQGRYLHTGFNDTEPLYKSVVHTNNMSNVNSVPVQFIARSFVTWKR